MSAFGRGALLATAKRFKKSNLFNFPYISHTLFLLASCGFVFFMCLVPFVKHARAEESKVKMSAEIVAPTNLFVPVKFTGWTVPFGKVILYDTVEDRIYIQQEISTDGEFSLEFVLDRVKDEEEKFQLFATYKGLETKRLSYTFKPSTYNPDTTLDIVLPPMIDLSREEVKANEEITVFGYACPQCNMAFDIVSDADTLQYSSLTNEYGYAEVILAGGLTADDYTIAATVTKESITSEPSSELQLKVTGGMLDSVYGFFPSFDLNSFIKSPIGIFVLLFMGLLFLSLLSQALTNIWKLLKILLLPFARRKKRKEADNTSDSSSSEPISQEKEEKEQNTEPKPVIITKKKSCQENYLVIFEENEKKSQKIIPNADGIYDLRLAAGVHYLEWHFADQTEQICTLVLDADKTPIIIPATQSAKKINIRILPSAQKTTEQEKHVSFEDKPTEMLPAERQLAPVENIKKIQKVQNAQNTNKRIEKPTQKKPKTSAASKPTTNKKKTKAKIASKKKTKSKPDKIKNRKTKTQAKTTIKKKTTKRQSVKKQNSANKARKKTTEKKPKKTVKPQKIKQQNKQVTSQADKKDNTIEFTQKPLPKLQTQKENKAHFERTQIKISSDNSFWPWTQKQKAS